MRHLRARRIGVVSIVLAGGTTIALAQTRERGATSTTILNNDTITVDRLHMAPGSAETIGATAPPFLVVQITPGDVEVNQFEENSRGPRPAAAVTYVPAGVGRHEVNIGATTFDLLLIRIKPTRAAAPAAPPTAAPPGITRTTLIDNDDVRVVRVRFAPDGREPIHTHPNDLLTMQISGGKVDILNGVNRSTAEREPGFVQFLPRGFPHAFASVDTKAFEILSVAIK